MSAAVNLAGELSLMFTVASPSVSYATVEGALVDAGFENFRIDRNPYSNYTDIVVTLYPPTDPGTGLVEQFPAEDALADLSAAAAHFGD